jgi:acyl-CoA thioester hydrolase
MFSSEVRIRVRYGETDRMGYVYYGNYAEYFEVGRVEALRELGMSYRDMEDSGVLLPVLDYSIKYLKPAYYDELLTIKTMIIEMPTARLKFKYETYNEAGSMINFGETTLVFVKKETGKPCGAPADFVERIKQYF